METRARIEASGKGQRWEFDKNKLFANSDYIAKVCGDLHKVSMVSFHAQLFFDYLECERDSMFVVFNPFPLRSFKNFEIYLDKN